MIDRWVVLAVTSILETHFRELSLDIIEIANWSRASINLLISMIMIRIRDLKLWRTCCSQRDELLYVIQIFELQSSTVW